MAGCRLSELFQTWKESCETGDFSHFLSSVQTYVQTEQTPVNVFRASDAKILYSLLCAAFSDNHPSSVQKAILDLISSLGADIFLRYRLIHSFSILKTLLFGLTSKTTTHEEQLKLLNLLQLYTTDLHHICDFVEPEIFNYILKHVIRIVRQSRPDDLLEPALGILANLSHFTELIKPCFKRKDDFEALRKCLLHIMTSDTANQKILVCSMAVRFHLWNSADKFFEGTHAHQTIQILFNFLLNGEINSAGLCAGELLSDLCAERETAQQLETFPGLKSCLCEVVLQLKAKNPSLLLKLLHLLRCFLVNQTSVSIRNHVTALFFQPPQDDIDEKDSALDPLGTLFTLACGSDDLVASAALDLLRCLIDASQPHDEMDKENANTFTIPSERIFHSLLFGMRKCHSATSTTTFKSIRLTASGQHWEMCARLLRLVLFIRVTDALVQYVQLAGFKPTDLANPTDQTILEQIPVLVDLASHIVNGQFEANPLIDLLVSSGASSGDQGVGDQESEGPPVDVDTCLLSANLAIEAMSLMYSCTELVATLSPNFSQDDEVSLTQPTGDTDIKSTPNMSKWCGQALQRLLECQQAPGLFALGLLTSSSANCTIFSLGMGPNTRAAVIRLLGACLHLDGFDNDRFIAELNRLQPINGNQTEIFNRLSSRSSNQIRALPSFLSQWLGSSAGGIMRSATSPGHEDPEATSRNTHQTEDKKQLEQRVDKFLTTWENQQSREDVLEASIRANTEALSQAHRLCDHYRERAAIVEAESSQLRPLHLEAMAQLEYSKRSISALKTQLEQREADLNEVRTQLSQKQVEYDELVRKTEGLQSKLLAAREQNRAMDATIDDYRTQLDQAKEQIQNQMAQINKFTQITRLINDLTGNPSSDVTMSAAHSISTASGDAPSEPITNTAASCEGTTRSGHVRKVAGRGSRR